MFRNDDAVEVFVNHTLEHVSVMTLSLLRSMIVSNFGDTVNDEYIRFLLKKMQSHGELYLSEDGYVMTKGAYITLTNDTRLSNLNADSYYMVKRGINYEESRDGKDVIDCMWLLSTMLPHVSEYVINSEPWTLQFIVPPKEDTASRIFQVAKFNRGCETPKALLIESSQRELNLDERKHLRRIALFDDESMAFCTPKNMGFNIVAVVDELQPHHYRILEKKKNSEAW